MKYGLILYNSTENLGDDILTYAAYKFLPTVDYIIDRENIDTFVPNEKEYVATIFNGWFLYNKFNWPPSEYIYPLFIGIHFSPNQRWGIGDEYLDGLGKKYLKKYEPIGCRDVDTLNKMQERNIEAFFSGCLTLTLQPFRGISRTNKVLLVDLDKDICEFITEKVGFENVEIISHAVRQKGKDWNERKDIVENRLKEYQSASLVITTRLHCALPCLALGTKVLMISRDTKDYNNRIASYEKYLNVCTADKLLSGQVDVCNIPNNSNNYKVLAESIRKKCQSFICNCQNRKLSELPDIDVFRKCLAGKMEWQRMLIKKEERVDVSEIYSAKEWLAEQYNTIKRELENYQKASEEQQKTIQDLIEGKKYLEKHEEEQEKCIQDLIEGKEYLEKHEEEQEKYIQELIAGKEYLEKHAEEQEKYIQELMAGKEYLEKHAEEQEKYIQELIAGKEYLEKHAEEQEKYIQQLEYKAKES